MDLPNLPIFPEYHIKMVATILSLTTKLDQFALLPGAFEVVKKYDQKLLVVDFPYM
jgi:hypothetical protein